MSIFLAIFKQELLILRRNSSKIINNLVFFTIFLTLYFLLNQGSEEVQSNMILELKNAKLIQAEFLLNQSSQNFGFLLSAITFATLTAILLYFGDFMLKDSKDGTVDQLRLVCQNFEIVIAAKILANWLSCCFALIIFGGFLTFIFGNDALFSLEFAVILLLMTLSLSCICGFCGHLSIFSNSLALSAILALPLCIPPILIAASISFSSFWQSFALLSINAIIAANITIFGSAKLVKIS